MGRIIGTGNYKHPIDSETLLTDYSLRYREWVCERCGKQWAEVKFKRLFDPDNLQPLVSQATQLMQRDPYRDI